MGVDPKGVDPNNIHSFNRYAYGNNNPYKYIDPDGKDPRLLWLVGQASYYVATRAGAGVVGSMLGIGIYNVLHNEAQNSNDTPGDKGKSPAGTKSDKGCIYCVKGDKTKSGKDYIGSTDNMDERKRDKSDGRNREGAEVVDTYSKGDREARRRKEQQAINDRGGVDKLDNRRNEVAPSKWPSQGINEPN